MGKAWQYVSLNNCPLLLKYEYGPSNYELLVTDLEHVWAHSLDRRGIIQSAFAQDSSIDPSEDASQMQLLLSMLQTAFDQLVGTTLEVSSTDSGQSVILQLVVPLPASIPDLCWKLTLHRHDKSALTDLLLIPLLRQQAYQEAEKNSLIAIIEEKDSVLEKLLKQIRADGLDLSKSYPGLVTAHGGKTADSRDLLSKVIKGLGPFDANAWTAQSLQCTDESTTLAEVLANVAPLRARGSPVICSNRLSTCWWDNSQALAGFMADKKSELVERTSQTPELAVRRGSSSFETQEVISASQAVNSIDDRRMPADEFSAAQISTPSRDHDDSTTDDEVEAIDLDRHTKDDLASTKRALGAPLLGSQKFNSSVSKEQDRSINSKILDAKPKRKLGMIGGKHEKDSYEPVHITSTTSSPNTTLPEDTPSLKSIPSPNTKSKRRLGIIGGQKEQAGQGSSTVFTPATSSDRVIPGTLSASCVNNSGVTTESNVVQSETPDSTVQALDRANQKREMLKRGLESERNRPVEKKKRKF